MILQRYVFRELALTFFFAFATIIAVCMVGSVFQVVRSFEGLGLELLAKTAPMALGYMAPWALLAASCIAPTLVYGRLAAENEITAMRTSGVPSGRILAPAVFFGILLAGVSYGFHEYVTPAAHYARRNSLRESVYVLLELPPAGKQSFAIGPYRLSYSDYREGRMERPYLVKYRKDGAQEAEYHAVSGTVSLEPGSPPQIVLSMPTYRQYGIDGSQDQVKMESALSIPIQIEEASEEKRLEDMRQGELRDELESAPDPARHAQILLFIHSRYAQALSPFLLVLVAVPIGTFVKRGSRLTGLGASLPPLILYLIVFFFFQGLGDRGRIDPLVAAYAPDAILLAIASVLLFRVYRT